MNDINNKVLYHDVTKKASGACVHGEHCLINAFDEKLILKRQMR